MEEPLIERFKKRKEILNHLLSISNNQYEAIRSEDDDAAIEKYLYWSRKFTEETRKMEQLDSEDGAGPRRSSYGDRGTEEIRRLLEEIQNIQQQTEKILRARFETLTAELKSTRQAKTAVTGYYGQKPHVSIYFDEKQ